MSTAVAIIPTGELQVMADAIHKGGLFGFKNKEQALSLMFLAQAQGKHPVSIVQDYHIFSTGKAGLKADTVLARFQEQGGTIEWLETTDKICRAKFTHKSSGSREFSWTIEEAQRANLTGKDVWKHYPSDMLRARCIYRGVRAMLPMVLGGMYGKEEVEDIPPTHEAAHVEFQVVADDSISNRSDFDSALSACSTKEECQAVVLRLYKGLKGSKEVMQFETGVTRADNAPEKYIDVFSAHLKRVKPTVQEATPTPPTPPYDAATAIKTFLASVATCPDAAHLTALVEEFKRDGNINDHFPCKDALETKAADLGLTLDLEET